MASGPIGHDSSALQSSANDWRAVSNPAAWLTALDAGRPELDDAVDDHRPHPFGEQLGELLADGGAVAEAEVVELVVAHGGPHRVDVAGDVGGAEVRQQVTDVLLAAVDVVLVDVEHGGGVVG